MESCQNPFTENRIYDYTRYCSIKIIQYKIGNIVELNLIKITYFQGTIFVWGYTIIILM